LWFAQTSIGTRHLLQKDALILYRVIESKKRFTARAGIKVGVMMGESPPVRWWIFLRQAGKYFQKVELFC
jgi:hypothetical protein